MTQILPDMLFTKAGCSTSFRQRLPDPLFMPPPQPLQCPRPALTDSHEFILSAAFQKAIPSGESGGSRRNVGETYLPLGSGPNLLLLCSFPTHLRYYRSRVKSNSLKPSFRKPGQLFSAHTFSLLLLTRILLLGFLPPSHSGGITSFCVFREGKPVLLFFIAHAVPSWVSDPRWKLSEHSNKEGRKEGKRDLAQVLYCTYIFLFLPNNPVRSVLFFVL